MLRQAAELLAGEFEVVGRLPDGRALRPAVDACHPDVVVLDITLPGTCGIELARGLAATPAPPRIVMLTVHADSDYVSEALEAGALGYVDKSRLASDLIPALRAVLDQRRFVSPSPGLAEWTGRAPTPAPASS
jgi:DNA-binding NarL/FixJ family response regulator